MRVNKTTAFLAALLLATLPAAAKEEPPTGVLAASVGNLVVLADPNGGRTVELDCGTVGWLFPAPGGILFAPDVIANRTTVINVRSLTVVDHIDGLTMPHFGESPDRYIAIAGEVVMVSHPDRAVMARIPAEIHNPWQVIIAPDDAAMLALERLPDGSTGVHITTVNLITRQVVYRRPVADGVIHMALSPQLGLVALADNVSNRIRLAEPATLTPMADHPTAGQPNDVAFAGGGKTLVTALATGDEGGALELALFKQTKKGLKLHKQRVVPLSAAPVRIALSPGGKRVAVALDGGAVEIVDIDARKIVATTELPGTPRDLQWCDLTREGPMTPEWSDGEPAELDLGPFQPKIKDGKSSGLEEPVWKKPPN
jgi:DNA-binding beta-propeller fold protein YncE